jgi:hypothetical protein
MSCGHGCGRGHHQSYDRDWCFRGDCLDDPLIGHRTRTWSQGDDEPAVEALEMRLAGLHGAVQRLATELAELRTHGVTGPTNQAPASEPRDR